MGPTICIPGGPAFSFFVAVVLYHLGGGGDDGEECEGRQFRDIVLVVVTDGGLALGG